MPSSENPHSGLSGTVRFPAVTVAHIQNCSFSSWHPSFRSCTIKSRCIPLSEEFVDYLNADGIFLPLDADGQHPAGYGSDSSDTDDESQRRMDDGLRPSGLVELPDSPDLAIEEAFAEMRLAEPMGVQVKSIAVGSEDPGTEDQDDEEPYQQHPSFPDLQRIIESTIEEMDGAVFPKLNWSSPKDASWVATGSTLKCVSAADVYLLLKASDFVAHDLGHAFENCTKVEQEGDAAGKSQVSNSGGLPTRPEQFELVLRKWYELAPSMEFRCFVRDNILIGITQRDIANFYAFLLPERQQLQKSVEEFFGANIQGRFPDVNYVFDVYINERNRRVWLLDFNPFSPETEPLLFSWNEILTAVSSGEAWQPEFRIIESQAAAVGGAAPAYTMNRLPRDAIDLSNGSTIDEFAERFRRNVYDAM